LEVDMKISFQRLLFVAAIAAVAALAALAGYAASSITVSTKFDPDADFSRYRSYAWTDIREVRDPNVKKRLEAAVDKQLQAKGLVRKDESADLKVSMHPRLSKEYTINPYDTGWDYGWGTWNTSIGDLSTGADTAKAVSVGTIIVDLVDPSTKQLVWRGTATSPFDSEASTEQRKDLLDKVMKKLFAGFPPKKK
jgi:hypothetical protein